MITSSINKEKLVRIFINKIKVPKKNLEKQIIIAPVGVVASGKTTAMKILKSMIPTVYINADEVRVFLRNKKMWGPLEAYGIITPTIRHFLESGESIIIDGDFVDKKTRRQPLENLAKKFDARVYYIHVIAPEKFILKKLKNKKWTKSGLFSSSTEGIREYLRRKPLHQKKLKIKFIGTVDTSKSVKSQLLKIVSKIK